MYILKVSERNLLLRLFVLKTPIAVEAAEAVEHGKKVFYAVTPKCS